MDIKSVFGCHIHEISDKNILRDIVFEDIDNITVDQIETLLKCFLVVYLYLAPPKQISLFYESVTSKKYFLGYRGIKLIFSHDRSMPKDYFMRAGSCYLEAEFYVMEEMNNTLLDSYDTFSIALDAQVDSLKHNTC